MMDLLNDISNQIQQSKINWSSISSSIGIDGNDILNIQKKCNPTVEFVHSVTKKIWKDIFDYVGLSLTSNDSYTEVSTILKLGEILAGRCFEENKEKVDIQIVEEISQKVSQWKIFGRILGLNESYLNQVERDFQSCYEQNHEIMKKFTSPLEPDESWLLWRGYLEQFEDGINVIKEMEATHVELLAETPTETSHIIEKGDQVYIGHSYGYEDNKSIQINKQDSIIGVQVGSKDFNCVDYQEFNEWVTTQQRYIDIYDMLKDQKSINFAEGTETFCPILDTIKQYLEITNDPGFVVKGYNYVKHYNLFKKGMFAKDYNPDTYLCYIANANVILYITKSSDRASHALYQSQHNIQIANTLHEDLQLNNVVQINVIIHENNQTSSNFCIENKLYVSKDIFTDIELFTSWYDELIVNFKIQNKSKEESSSSSRNDNKVCEKLKKDIVTYEALENNIFPSFSNFHEDQIEELKKLVVLSPTQFKVLHSKEKHILLRGSYGCGKSLALLKKLEEVISNKGESDIIYFICNDQQSQLIHYMKFIQSKFPEKHILVCNSFDIIPFRKIPKLSLILEHVLQVWKNKIIHIFMDEFNGSYIDGNEVIRLSRLLNSFENSFIVIALQSMEEILLNDKKGYQYDLLSAAITSFVCHNLDYSLRCSYEINEFVKSTAKLLESVEVDALEKSYYVPRKLETYELIVDKKQGREEEDNKVSKSHLKSFYRYNQPDIIGHHVLSGPVNVYYVENNLLFGKEKRSNIFLSILKFILQNATAIKHYVICTYDEKLYNIAYDFLNTNIYYWTVNVNEFLKQDKPFTILLTEYAGVRGYEFENFIFLLPLGKKFLKFRMIECFTRATTELHIIADNTNRKSEAVDKQLIKRWKKLEVVKFFDCKYYRRSDTIDLVHDKTKIFSDNYINVMVTDFRNEWVSTWYRWGSTEAISEENYFNKDKESHKQAALLCILNADDTRLFDEFCTAHNIDIVSYVIQKDGYYDMLSMAVEVNATKITRLLIENHNFDVIRKTNLKKLRFIASRNGNTDIVRLLEENGADVST